MSQIFALYNPSTLNSAITIGTNGFKIIHCENARWQLYQVSILFDNIHAVSTISNSQDYIMFMVRATAIETPDKVNIYEIKMRNKIYEVHKLITDGYNQACFRKDNLLGI